MRRRFGYDGGVAILVAAVGVMLLLVTLALLSLHPARDALGSAVTAPLSRLEAPLRPPTTTTEPPPATVGVTTTPPATVGPGEVFYRDCVEARALGVTDLRKGQPGYRAQLDRDGDGRACESPPVPSTTSIPTPPTAPPRRPPVTLAPLPPTTRLAPLPPRTAPTPAASPATTIEPTTAPPLATATTVEPTTAEPTTATPTTEQPTTTEPPPTTAPPPRFTDCNQVVAAGLDVPLTPDSPWWNPALDVDGDGFACEDDSPIVVPTTTTTMTPPVDCVAAWDLGLAPIAEDSPYWRPGWTADGRSGVACATDPRLVTVVSSTSSSSTTADGGR